MSAQYPPSPDDHMTLGPILDALYTTIIRQADGDPQTSYTAHLRHKGRQKIAQKIGEEAVETALAAVSQTQENVIKESADLLYHLMVLWADCHITPAQVLAELKQRDGLSGLEEKARRKP